MKLFRYIKKKLVSRKFKRRNRSMGGDIALIVILGLFGIFSLFPLLYTITSAFKPFSEIFIFPPRLTVDNPTFRFHGSVPDCKVQISGFGVYEQPDCVCAYVFGFGNSDPELPDYERDAPD